MTQEKLAERAEVSVRYVQRVEAGSENVTVRTLAKFANALRVDLAALLSPPATLRRAGPGRPRQKP